MHMHIKGNAKLIKTTNVCLRVYTCMHVFIYIYTYIYNQKYINAIRF